MTTRSANVAFPIHRFAPSRIHTSPSRRAVVRRPPATSEPPCGSVKPKAPIFSKRLIAGSHRRFCSSEPQVRMVPMARPVCTCGERRHGRVDMCQLQRDEAREEVARPGFRGVRVGPVHQAELPEALDQLEREFGPGPAVVDDRGDLRAEERAKGLDLLPLTVRQQFLVRVEVGGQQPSVQVGTGRCRQSRCAAHGSLPQALWGVARGSAPVSALRARRSGSRTRLNADPEPVPRTRAAHGCRVATDHPSGP